jgi:hypothetical protein
MSDFVRDLEAELISAAHRRARQARRHLRPPALVTAALVTAALAATALLPRAGGDDSAAAVTLSGTCSFPDATLLLRDAPCTSNPFGQ